MDLFKIIGDCVLSAWIWSFTFDWFHPIVAGCTMFVILRVIVRRARVNALMISSGAQIVALLVLTAFVVYMSEGLQWRYEPIDECVGILMGEFVASLVVGFLYTCIQTIYFLIGRLFFTYNLLVLLIVTVLSNLIGVFGSYVLLRMSEIWYYAS